jgi:hypothetical protein
VPRKRSTMCASVTWWWRGRSARAIASRTSQPRCGRRSASAACR